MLETTVPDLKAIETLVPTKEGLSQSSSISEPDMDESIDQKLLAFVLEAQCHPPQSIARQQALTRLVITIEQSGQLNRLRKYAQFYAAPAFADLYNEAKQKMYFYICQKPELYRREHPVMAWVNSTLSFKFRELMGEQPAVPLFEPDKIPSPEADREHEKLQVFLETDPEGKLATYAVRNHPTVTFQCLAIARHIQGKTWRELANQTGIPIQTLSCFFQRTLQKLLPYFNQYL